MLVIFKILCIALGVLLILFTVISVIRTFVLPRSENVWLNRIFWNYIYSLFLKRAQKATTYEGRDRVLAFFAPVIVVMQPFVYLSLLAKH